MFRKDKNLPHQEKDHHKNDQHTNEQTRKFEIIEDALLESISGGTSIASIDLDTELEIDLDIDPPICVGSQFCQLRIFD